MENGNFQSSSSDDVDGFMPLKLKSRGSSLDFFENMGSGPESLDSFNSSDQFGNDNPLPPAPNEEALAFAPSPDLGRSQTISTLMTQNEELVARLNVTLRSMNLIEIENESLKQQSIDLQTRFKAFSDQIMIWKEKEKFWKSKNFNLEAQLSDIKRRFPEFEQMENKINRLQKYHEKVKTQVKPFITNLKAYSESLAREVRSLNTDLETREAELYKLKIELQDSYKESQDILESEKSKHLELLTHFENDREAMQKTLSELEEKISHLEFKLQDYEITKVREDDLENLTISLTREKHEASIQYEEKIVSLEEEIVRLTEFKNDILNQIEAVASESEKIESENSDLKSTVLEQKESLDSTRMLLKGKCDEVEKLQEIIKTHEKINSELQKKLTKIE